MAKATDKYYYYLKNENKVLATYEVKQSAGGFEAIIIHTILSSSPDYFVSYGQTKGIAVNQLKSMFEQRFGLEEGKARLREIRPRKSKQ